MTELFSNPLTWLSAHSGTIIPLILALWMAWGDVRTRRIPNYLTLGTALAGLAFQLGSHGWHGLSQGLLGMVVGLALLILFYAKGGVGAGDVKALAALGAWLGPSLTFVLFIYMALTGGLLILGYLAWQGRLWAGVRRLWHQVLNLVLCRPAGSLLSDPPPERSQGFPYAVALAVGMAWLCWQDLFPSF